MILWSHIKQMEAHQIKKSLIYSQVAKKIKVVLSKHALLDCLPLRFGVTAESPNCVFEGIEDVNGTARQKPYEIKKGNKHYVGTLFFENGKRIDNVRIVLTKEEPLKSYRIGISVLTKDISLADRAVGDLIRDLRETGEISTTFISTKLHALYVKKAISNSSSLFRELVKLGIKLERQKYGSQRLDGMDRAEINNLLEYEAVKFNLKQSDVGVSYLAILSSVELVKRKNSSGKIINCVRLTFENTADTRIMDEWCDPFGFVQKKADTLIGKQIITTTWKPDKFGSSKWFRNVYEVNEDNLIVFPGRGKSNES